LGRHAHNGVITVCWDDCAGVTAQACGVMTGLHGPYAPSRLASEHHDPAISGANMLQSVDGHGPLRDLSLIVAGLALAGLVGFGG
jgi:hypothetical protein